MNTDQITTILNRLGDFANTQGAQVFAIAVRQAVVSSIVWMAVLFLVFVVLTVALVFFVRHLSKQIVEDPITGLFVVGLVVVSQLFAVILFAQKLIILLNPQYQALTDLLGRITGSR